MKTKHISPCGMNCVVCIGFLRDKNKCPGCRSDWEINSKYIRKCIIRNCDQLKNNNWKFCSRKCENYPCKRLKSLDKRYKTKYGMSMLENLENIDKYGIRKFIDMEKKRWIMGHKIFCVHNRQYFNLK